MAMDTRTIEVPEEILQLLEGSRLRGRPDAERVRIALAIHLFLDGVISIGRAAELAGEPRVDFEWLLVQMGVPTVHYEVADYEQDLRGFSEADRRDRAS
jgi:predicted HTH domain antitoxin